ncbi:MAG: YncE family protein [Actinobacteria bacterium]|nr:MAG: YncE family protein [Actinomycetota bacterium]
MAALVTIVVLVALAPAALAAKRPGPRDVLVVSNNWAGSAHLVDPHTFKRLKRINVIPDRAQRVREIEADPMAKFYFDNIRTLVGEGHNQYVDDGFTSPDGRVVYFSRPSFADVVAIDLKSGKIRWRTKVDGYRADHMAISKNGRRLLVSASTANVVDVIATRTGRIVGRIPSGDSPHENNFSRDGSKIFHASIGLVYTDTDDPSEDATKGERVFEVIDARTYRVLKRIDMGQKLAEAGHPNTSSAVRPMAITPDERYVYFQLSFLFGIVQYDLRSDRVVKVLQLPLGAAEGLPRTEFLLDSAHHGLAMSPKGTKLCVAGTMSRYAAIVTRSPFRLERTIPVGRDPYWSHSSENGKYCFVSVAGEDRVSVISFKSAREVASIRVGDHPQRMRTGVIRRGYLGRVR